MERWTTSNPGRWSVALALGCALTLGCNENLLQELDPDIFVSPEEVDFGTVTVGVSSQQTLAIHNVGGGTLSVDSVEMVDPAGPFSVQDFGGTLSSEDVTEVQVTFLPSELGPAEGSIRVISDDPDEAEVLVPVFAVDVLEAPTPAIAWSPSSLDWGAVPSGGAVTMSVTVSSVGTADLAMSDIYLDGSSSAEFTLETNPAPTTLAPSYTTQIDVLYTPTDEVADSGTLVILNDDPDTPQVEIPLSGELQPAPDIELVPSQLVFGEVSMGTTVTMDAEIWSLGDVDLELGTLIPAGSSEFTMITDPGGALLAPGDHVTVTVSYTPIDLNPDTGAIEIPSNDPDEPVVTLMLAGQHEPVPDIEVDPIHVDFGLVGVGVTATETVAVTNVGTGDLTVDAPVLTGSSDFGISAAQFPAVIAPNSTELILVSCLPTDLADDTGEIAITSDDADEPLVIVTLVGAAEPAPDIDLFPTTLSFGSVMIGATSALDATISNLGTADLELGSLAVVNASEFTITVDPSFQTLGPNDTTTVQVTYAPVNAGSDTGLVEIPSNDPDENPVFLVL
ncbi:MAG: choice-of-anchor D domain-containing protein [Myxococcota bacterium]|nr:choice-of-anchor D domain-containing protein [Myxococcota bacterium]